MCVVFTTVVAKTNTQFILGSTDEQLTLDLLKPGMATGVDCISPRLLRMTATGVAESLVNSGLTIGDVTPVLKKGSKMDITKYRPLSYQLWPRCLR